MEADERDRKREKEELEEIRQRLLAEGHPDPDAELQRVRYYNIHNSILLRLSCHLKQASYDIVWFLGEMHFSVYASCYLGRGYQSVPLHCFIIQIISISRFTTLIILNCL